ncbi:hypothetical protein F511_16692 [Dorcoceras hygrometricum]|uniref:Uncharacterized protein n=1 Tax=Dorcoceras hygrometricum TaxID=472368 RepID=A0A2Z7CR91_9LAMI|nr:hypothetical protein F511_16692 [Dorcoceras hygrometricum]
MREMNPIRMSINCSYHPFVCLMESSYLSQRLESNHIVDIWCNAAYIGYDHIQDQKFWGCIRIDIFNYVHPGRKGHLSETNAT